MALRSRPGTAAGSPRDRRPPREVRSRARRPPPPGAVADRAPGAAPEAERVPPRARRPEPPAAATLTPPGHGEQGSDRRAFGWWRTRSWRIDLAVLARVRTGLLALPDAEPAAEDGATPPDGSPQPGSQPDPPPQESQESQESPADPAISAIHETFAAVGKAGDEAAAYFYAWLFLRQPPLRNLLPPAMDEQRDRLFRPLAPIGPSLRTPQELARYLPQLGPHHR